MAIGQFFSVLFAIAMGGLYIAVFVFMLVMLYKFVKAVERIANSLDRGLFIVKRDEKSENLDQEN